NLLCSERNVSKAQLRANLNYIEEPSDDEEFLDESPPEPSTPFAQTAIGRRMMKAAAFLSSLSPTMRKLMAMASNNVAGEVVMKTVATEPLSSETKAEAKVFMSDNTIITMETDNLFKIPRPLLNLAKAKVHVPLTLLTNVSLCRIHEDPSCVKLKKGLVLEDPKLCVMDTSNGFPPKATLTADVFFEATNNFLKLLTLIIDNITVQRFTEHRQFCMSRDAFTSNFQAILNFNIETHRRFFNTHIFLDHNTYKEHWTEVKVDSCLDRDRVLQEQARQMMGSPFIGAKETTQPTTSFALSVVGTDTN
ncbi:hypothetical protein BDR05DRAFT_1005772, partial [Suillus weaverae]